MKVKEEEEERETEKLALWVHIHVASPQQLISTNQLVQLIGPPLWGHV